jgi:type I restriction enzyme S subunit
VSFELQTLPEGWEWSTVGEVARTQLGKMLSAKARGGANPVPYLRNQNVQWGRIELDNLREMAFSEAEVAKFSLQNGDLVMCEGGEPGRCAIWESDGTMLFQKALHRIRPGSRVLAEWLFYYFRWLAAAGGFVPYTSGIGIRHLPQEDLRLVPVPIPPLNEQARIVKAFASIEAALKEAKADIADAAGDLAQLRHRLFSDVYRQSWPLLPLGRVLREKPRNGHSAKASESGQVRTLSLTAVTKRAFTDENTKLTDADPSKVHDLWLEPDDILVQRSNTPDLVGSAARYAGKLGWAIFPDLLIRVRPSEMMIPEFLEVILEADESRAYFRRSARGTAGSMPKINQGIIEALEVPVPTIDEQASFVSCLRDQLAYVDDLGAELEAASATADAMLLSTLRSATHGQLVPPDGRREVALNALAVPSDELRVAGHDVEVAS